MPCLAVSLSDINDKEVMAVVQIYLFYLLVGKTRKTVNWLLGQINVCNGK